MSNSASTAFGDSSTLASVDLLAFGFYNSCGNFMTERSRIILLSKSLFVLNSVLAHVFLGVFQGDVESVGTLSPAGSFHGSYATEPCPMAAQVVVKSTFLDVEEARSAAKCPGGSDAWPNRLSFFAKKISGAQPIGALPTLTQGRHRTRARVRNGTLRAWKVQLGNPWVTMEGMEGSLWKGFLCQ